MMIDEYTPCRINECFLEAEDYIELTNINGTLRLTGYGCVIWKMLDGKHTINSIVEKIANELNAKNNNEIKLEVISFLRVLKEKKIIIANWDPLYKFELNQEL